MANEAEPHEILLAIHKRVVDTEKLMTQYRTHAQNLEITIAMLQERIEKLENKEEEENRMWLEKLP
jgi:predicted RNase H-like nuclease (RuvC/YqgF family)